METRKDAKKIIKDVQVKMEAQSNLSPNPSPSSVRTKHAISPSYGVGLRHFRALQKGDDESFPMEVDSHLNFF